MVHVVEVKVKQHTDEKHAKEYPFLHCTDCNFIFTTMKVISPASNLSRSRRAEQARNSSANGKMKSSKESKGR